MAALNMTLGTNCHRLGIHINPRDTQFDKNTFYHTSIIKYYFMAVNRGSPFCVLLTIIETNLAPRLSINQTPDQIVVLTVWNTCGPFY